ncbi:hypothetical protein THRCLA_20799 [Thraustotheca clavata]|uniref:Uncharacterized protein n=1 Tax=Thraustotheca clavata TaxID=74557 RepID=A0A1W0A3Z4_9STRA|nr:hypothetical protein THRCLA_20799 [Thraustotheca clavata]
MTCFNRALSNTVAPIVGPSKYVAFNKPSIFMSIIMFLNVAIMLLKTYIFEPLPWESNEHIEFLDTCYENISLCTPIAINYFKNKNQIYERGDTWEIFRLPVPELPPPDEDPSKFLLILPYSIYFDKF